MNVMEMRAYFGRAHEFFAVLEKAGFSDKLIKETINSPGNVMAQKMFAAVSNKTVVSKDKKVRREMPVLCDTFSIFTFIPSKERFIAKNKLVVNIGEKAEVKISGINESFTDWFSIKTEEPFSVSKIYGHGLNKNSSDDYILAELGGQERSETILAEVYAMMRAQSEGQSGDLLNNGDANIFYVRDISNTLRTLAVRYGSGGWNVLAYLVGRPFIWGEGFRVFSHCAKTKIVITKVVKKNVKKDATPVVLIPNNDSYYLPKSYGGQLIYQAEDVFKKGIDKKFVELGLTKQGIYRGMTSIEGHSIFNGLVGEIYSSLPGSWEDKWFSQNQVIDYCRKFAPLHWNGNTGIVFLIKKDEAILVDEANYLDNLFAVVVSNTKDGLLVDLDWLDSVLLCRRVFPFQIITPKLLQKGE